MARITGKLSPRLALPLLLAALGAQAQSPDWHASVGVLSEYTNNAGKISGDDTLSERQDEWRFNLGGDYSNNLLDLGVNYRASQRRFSEDSQENRNRLEGRSELMVGKPYHVGDLHLSHTRQSVFNAPDDVELLRNTDEREIVTARPSLRWRASPADTLVASGNYARIDYRFAPERRSERTGATLSWLRRVSPTDSFTFSAQQMDVSFDAIPQLDYEQTTVTATYSVDLRRLSYQIQLGRNENRPTMGERVSSPRYGLDVDYTSGANVWSLSANRFLTDSSAGSSNAGDFDSFRPRDSSAGRLDRLERTDAQLNWRNEAACQRCTLTTGIFYRTDDYEEINEDRSELGYHAGFDYRLAPRSSVSLGWDRRNHRFDEENPRIDYRLDRSQVSYQHRFVNGLSTRLFVRHERRTSQWADEGGQREYTETAGGISLTYDLL